MPYAWNYVYLVAKGHFGVSSPPGIESWQAGFKFHAPSGADYSLTNRTAFATGCAPAFSTFHQLAAVMAGNNSVLDKITCAHIGTDGKYVAGGFQTTAEYVYPTPIAGAVSPKLPLGTAMVLSLRTARPRGVGSRGRVYWPATGLGLDAVTGLFGTSGQTAYAAAAKTLLDALSSQAGQKFGEGAALIVASNVGNGTASYVTRVGIGAKADHQERREKSQQEAHVFSTLVAPPSVPIDPVLLEAQDSNW